MKLWLDDLRPAPTEAGWVLAHSVNEAILALTTQEITFASLDHDLGEYEPDGGDGIKLLLWMAEHNIWPTDGIEIHSMNPVGAANMLSLVERYAPYRATRRNKPF